MKEKGTLEEQAALCGVLANLLGILKRALRQKAIDLNEGNRILVKMIEKAFYAPLKSLKKS